MKELQSTTTTNKKRDTITVFELLRLYSTQWRYVVVSVIVFLSLGALYAYMKSPIYEVQANVLITDNDTKSDFLRSFSIADMFSAGSSVDDEIGIMYSYTLFNHIVKEFQLNEKYIVKKNFLKRVQKFDNTPVEVIAPLEFADTVIKPIRFKLKVNDKGLVNIKAEVEPFITMCETENKTFPVRFDTPYGEFVFNKTSFFTDDESLNMNIVVSSYNSATQELQRNVMCAIPNKKANIITVSLNSTSIPFAEKIVNAVVDGYNTRGIEENKARNQITFDFVNNRLDDITAELSATERLVEQYKNDNNLVDLEADAKYIFTKKGTIDEELVKAETETEILEMTRALMNDPKHKYDLIPTPMGAEAAAEAIAEYNKLVLERIRLLNNAKANNVALRTITSQLDVMRDNINATLDRSLASAEVRLKDLRNQMNESDSRLGELPRQEREFLNIKRHQVVQENIYLLLLQHREETTLRMANVIPKGQIIDSAYPLEGQTNLTTMQIMFIFFLLGLLVVPAWAYLKSLFYNKFSSKDEFVQHTNLPIIGEIGKIKGNSKLIAADPKNDVAEMFRLFRTNLQFLLLDSEDKTVLISSTRSGAGKTFISVNLAACLAMNGKKTLLIGLDFRNPQIKNWLEMPSDVGVSEYLISPEIRPADLITHSKEFTGLDVIAAGAIPPNPTELLSSQRLEALLTHLKAQYDYIILDSAPLGQISDAMILSRLSDLTIVVCRLHHTTFEEIDNLNELVSRGQIRRAGLLINGVKSVKTYGN